MASVNREREAKLTQEQLKELLHYNPASGAFTWLKTMSNRAAAGNRAGGVSKTAGYHVIKIDGFAYRSHRLAFLYMTASWPSHQLDHINGIKTDNRWCNLRGVTAQDNQKNKRLGRNNTSGFVGVVWCKVKGKWYAQVRTGGKVVYLGYFTDKEDAIVARKAANIKYGYHENHGR